MIERIQTALVEDTIRYFASLLKNPLQESSDLLGDKIRQWRIRNRIKFLIATRKTLLAQGIDPTTIDEDIFMPVMEKAEITSDPSLVAKYSALLANSLNENSPITVHPSFLHCLSQLSSIEIRIIDGMFDAVKKTSQEYRKKGYTLDTIQSKFQVEKAVALLAFDNLWRLGICDHGGSLNDLNRAEQIVFTDYGWALMSACCPSLD
jgi:hypothetical protein